MLSNGDLQFDPTSKESLEAYIETSVQFLDFTVLPSSLFECAAHVTLSMFPAWKREDLVFFQCKDGITNKLVKCTNTTFNFSILIRAFGNKSEVLIDRKQEIMNLITLSKLGLSPPLYGRFNNGLVYGFIPGEVLSVPDLSDPHKSNLIAKNMAMWHDVKMAGAGTPTLFLTLRKWLNEVPHSYSNPKINQTFQKNFNLDVIKKEMETLQIELEKINAPVVFCHNDLLHANLIYNTAKDQVSFIDYEYGSYSYRGFDIGNHFNEFAGFECDYKLYPRKDFQLRWLQNYLFESNSGVEITKDEIEALYREVNKFALASHFYWGLWALFTPAILKGYSRKKVLGADYPAIVSSENQHEVYGVLVQGLSRIEIEQLDKWEGDQYIRKNVEVYIRKLPPSNGNHPEYQSSKPEATQLFSNEDYEAISKSTNSLLVSAQTYVWIDSPAFLKDEDWEPEEFLKNLMEMRFYC
ncbi:hypothetical protein G9A89_016754 [Geosiphon pyriformis]|nr:hypothetical protein G9A89_016754 [Geosiphon pyriformis]